MRWISILKVHHLYYIDIIQKYMLDHLKTNNINMKKGNQFTEVKHPVKHHVTKNTLGLTKGFFKND